MGKLVKLPHSALCPGSKILLSSEIKKKKVLYCLINFKGLNFRYIFNLSNYLLQQCEVTV